MADSVKSYVILGALVIFVLVWLVWTLLPLKSQKPVHKTKAFKERSPDIGTDEADKRTTNRMLQARGAKVKAAESGVGTTAKGAPGSYVQRYESIRWWVTNVVTDMENRSLLQGPATPRTIQLVSNTPGPDYGKGNVSVGSYSRGLIFCEFWTTTYTMFLLDCLPRLLKAVDTLALGKHFDDPDFVIFCPGAYFAFQYLVEVLGIPERQVVLMPYNLVWDFKYPHYFITIGTMLYAPMLWDLEANIRTVREKVLQSVAQTAAAANPQGEARVLFSERADMTMPKDFRNFSAALQHELMSDGISLQTGRLETLRIRVLLQLLQHTTLYIGPSGWRNAADLVFLPPKSVVVEMFASKSTIPTNMPLNLMKGVYSLSRSNRMDVYDLLNMKLLGSKQEESSEQKMTLPVIAPFITDGSKESTLAYRIASVLGLSYMAVYPDEAMKPQSQPIFAVQKIATLIRQLIGPKKAQSNPAPLPLFLSPPLLGCENLFHKSKYPIQKGLFKQVHLTPDFALKLARTGDWKRMLKEMLMQRNLSEPQITPPVALCFDRPMYAQSMVRTLGRQGQTKAERLPDARQFYVAVAGFLRVWYSHEARGEFLFYCDPGPKNWGIPKEGLEVLQMYDLDTSTLVLPGALCSKDMDCGCEPIPESACVNGRCTKQGMARKIDKQIHGWLKVLITLYAPKPLLQDEETKSLIAHCKRGPIRCDNIKAYIRSKAPDLYDDLPQCEGRVLSIDWKE